MNIFVLDNNPSTAANYLCDKHVVKMVLETAQILCTIANQQGLASPYKTTHGNHPCTVWARESLNNWLWLVEHGSAIALEYTKRYGKVHKSQAVINWCFENIPNLPDTGLTPFAQAMPDEYRCDNAVAAYRAYYRGAKADIATWKSEKPEWW